MAAGGRLSHRPRRSLPPQLRPRHASGHPPEPGDPDTNGGLAPPNGLDTWFGFVGSQTLYQGATFSDNGVAVHTGANLHDYSTRVINREAVEFVRTAHDRPAARSFSRSPTSRPTRAMRRPPATAARAVCRSPSATSSASSPTCRCPSRRRSTSRRSATSRTGSAPARRSATPAAPTSSSAGAARWPRCRASTAASVSSSPSCAATASSTTPRSSSPPTTATSSASTGSSSTRSIPYEEALRVPLLARVPGDLLGPNRHPPRSARPSTRSI